MEGRHLLFVGGVLIVVLAGVAILTGGGPLLVTAALAVSGLVVIVGASWDRTMLLVEELPAEDLEPVS